GSMCVSGDWYGPWDHNQCCDSYVHVNSSQLVDSVGSHRLCYDSQTQCWAQTSVGSAACNATYGCSWQSYCTTLGSDPCRGNLNASSCQSSSGQGCRWDAAGYAYRRAAALLAPADAKRAHSYAARCFDAAGLTVLANESRVAADEAPIDAPTSKPMTPPAREATNGSVDPPASARPTVTADDKPVVPVNRIGAKPASTSTGSSASTPQFAVQVGAFTSAERASQIAAELRARCVALDIECPRVVTRDESNGALLHVVQFGCFPNRGAANKILLQFPKSGYRVAQYCAAELEAPAKPGTASTAGASKVAK
ncbi:MAG: hypothetical protein RL354_1401, partial [Planctomycetota bacterium]